MQLGEKITAKITAKYYFGAPVTEARVKYKVLRTPHDERLVPAGAVGLALRRRLLVVRGRLRVVPGLGAVGLHAAVAVVVSGGRPTQPEVVAESEAEIGPDGTLEVEIDTAAAKEFHPDQDHRYQIQAEVVDQSRRTIVADGAGAGGARAVPRLCVGATAATTARARRSSCDMAARTLDGKPVKGDGVLRLLEDRVRRRASRSRTKSASWTVPTDDQGQATLQIKAARPGSIAWRTK